MAGFQDIIGQEQIVTHFKNALRSGQVAHAYIINGERSSGKEFVANVFATALQCEADGERPCGECLSCKQAKTKNHPDIINVMHDKPNTIGVDDIRAKINNDIAIKPYSGPYKIYIMNESEKMTVQAQNALLKTLEEPPAYAVILLLTTNLDTLLPTVISRCVTLNMRPVKDELVKEYLMNEVQVPEYKADVCVAFARGNLGRAKALAASEEFDNIKTEAVNLLRYIREMEITEIVTAINKIKDYKIDINDCSCNKFSLRTFFEHIVKYDTRISRDLKPVTAAFFLTGHILYRELISTLFDDIKSEDQLAASGSVR